MGIPLYSGHSPLPLPEFSQEPTQMIDWELPLYKGEQVGSVVSDTTDNHMAAAYTDRQVSSVRPA